MWLHAKHLDAPNIQLLHKKYSYQAKYTYYPFQFSGIMDLIIHLQSKSFLMLKSITQICPFLSNFDQFLTKYRTRANNARSWLVEVYLIL